MLFHSGSFLVLFTVLVAVFTFHPKARVLLWASLLYYGLSNGWLMATLIVTAVVDYGIARAIHRRRRRWQLVASIASSSSILVFFKVDPLAIGLPIGISFYTFQSISYVVDVYRGRLKPCEGLREYALYLSFFPQIVAGPIVRGDELLPQLRRPMAPSGEDVTEGMQRIVAGVAKKALIADYLGVYADLVFGSPASYAGPEVVLAVYAYALQIYFDFSGYSDVAIGMARVLGVRLPENFEAPYRAKSIADFWRRWHITLSRWVRDYLFIPLGLLAGRNRVLRYASVLASMVLVGLWHGIGWGFLLWGALHGAALVAHARWRLFDRWLITFHFVVLSWIPFRSPTLGDAALLLRRATIEWDLSRCLTVLEVRGPQLLVMGFGATLALCPPRWLARPADWFVRAPTLAKAAVFVLLAQSVLQMRSAEIQPFIYFQF
ncbi:MAG: MBOAT family O-acyltransferase [Polyangiaceae bacterium]